MSSSRVVSLGFWFLWLGSLTLESCVDDPLLLGGSSIWGEVIWNGVVYLDQSGLLVDDDKLVFISQPMVTCAQLSDGVVILVQESSVAMSMSVRSIMASLETEQNILALVPSSLEVGGPDREICEARPDEVASVCEDIGSCL